MWILRTLVFLVLVLGVLVYAVAVGGGHNHRFGLDDGILVKDNHIDPDLFRLFLESGVYRHYAEKFLNPEQIDEVDVQSYLR